MRYLPAALVLVLLAFACSCSQSSGVSGTPIGPEGGVVTGPDNAMVQIPAGALDQEVEITISKASLTPEGFRPTGDIYEFGPAGTVFAEPVEITLPYDESLVEGPEANVRVWWTLSPAGPWSPLDGAADTAADTVTGLATHFSYGAPGEPLSCQPDCADRTCGPDGCGDLCPPGCGAGEACKETTGACECAPDCTGRDCGPDPVCQTSCGDCGANQTCSAAGACECVYEPCGTACCAADEVCHSGSCCLGSCGTRQCGDDGCGGSCGTCGTGLHCSPEGACVDCLTEADCAFAQYCSNNLCEDAYSAQTPFCDPCEGQDPLSCGDRANLCLIYPYAPPEPFAQVSDEYCGPDCYDTGLCPNGFSCSAITIVKQSDLCNSDADCPGGLPCLGEPGELGFCPCHDTNNPCPANTCSQDSYCANGTCFMLTLPCTQDSDCYMCSITMHHCLTDADCRPVLCEPFDGQDYGGCVNTKVCGLTQDSHCPPP